MQAEKQIMTDFSSKNKGNRQQTSKALANVWSPKQRTRLIKVDAYMQDCKKNVEEKASFSVEGKSENHWVQDQDRKNPFIPD
ncbi:hypothetical protein CEXT_580501 [Caerostris extrusa]|uniref:Uncharacterized protein n=1 Tax=Caerostris extrusa TaxID=172846 RepID=A0AAV4X6S7_CAEEX|nr:hypothetical protein CEXT_580501 [Caerostris extrusa]